jgi:DNA-binding MarR family transcriptional regulator
VIPQAAKQVMEHYPRIFFACHQRHRRDPQTQRLLSAHQASILDHLDEVEPTGLLELAMHMGVTSSTMCISTSRLVRQGYVESTRDPRDGRRVQLRLTAAGVRVKDASSVLEPERVQAMLAHLSAEELQAGIAGLALLARAAQEEMHSRSSAGRGPADSEEAS